MNAPPAPAPQADRFDVVGLGEISLDDVLLVDEVPPWGGKARVRRRVQIGGGQVATAMFAARRLGLRAALVGVVGASPSGDAALAELVAEGVDVSGVRRVPSQDGVEVTHRSVIVVDGRGERTVLFSEPEQAERQLEPDATLDALVTAGRALHVDGNLLGPATRAARLARRAGCLVSLDLDRYQGAATDALLALADLCVVSPAFMADLADAPDADAAIALLPTLQARLRPSALACVTLGARGAAARVGASAITVLAPVPPNPIIDTTACGDTFRAALLAALLDEPGYADLRARPPAPSVLEAALRFACAAAALKTRDLGRLGCPTRGHVSTFLRPHGHRP